MGAHGELEPSQAAQITFNFDLFSPKATVIAEQDLKALTQGPLKTFIESSGDNK
jgi:hypothetical protein